MVISETTIDQKAKNLQMATSAAAAALAAAAIAKQNNASTSAAAAAAVSAAAVAALKNTVAATAITVNNETAETSEKDAKPMYPRLYNKIVLTLENSLVPEDKLDETPSHTDGLDAETEKDLRILGCELIQTAGILLRLPQVAMATGQVLFQRFFYSKSFVRHNMETVAMSCICLASKIEEAPRRIRDVINVFNHIKQVHAQKDIRPMILDHYYTSLKDQVIKAERRVLKELGFCVHVKHPHKLIVMYLQVLRYEKNEQLMQMSWNFMNDSLRTDVFMRYNPETIACACINLSARKLCIPLPSNPSWFGIFNVNEDDIIDISYRVMDLYVRPKANAEQLKASVDELRNLYMETRNKNKEFNSVPAVVAVDRNNGSHNAWGGFIQRAVPLPLPTDKHSEKDSRSRSHSRSRTVSAESEQQYKRSSKKTHRNKERDRERERERERDRHRSRSRTRSRSQMTTAKSKKKRHYEKSLSTSPQIKRHKRKNSRDHERHRDRDYERERERDYDRDRDRNYERENRGDRDYDRDRERGGDRDMRSDYYTSHKERYSGGGGGGDKYYDKYYDREYYRTSGSSNKHQHHHNNRGMTHRDTRMHERSRDRKR